MSWIIERDNQGIPLRMIWSGIGEQPSEHNEYLKRMIQVNSLPMRSMRDWAKQHGLSHGEDSTTVKTFNQNK